MRKRVRPDLKITLNGADLKAAIKRKQTRVRIVSDGTSPGTCVYIDGKLMDNVIAAGWGLDVDQGVAVAVVTFASVAIEAEGVLQEQPS